jgi:hypothetical protein
MWDNGGALNFRGWGLFFFLLVRKLRKGKSYARAMDKCAVMGIMAFCPYILDEEYGWLWGKQG